MEQETVHEEVYKNCTIKIIPDSDNGGPDEWQDEGMFLVHYHTNFQVERNDIVTKEELGQLFHDEVKTIDVMKEYHIFFTKAYIHSGVSLALIESGKVYPDEQWDVSRCGAVLVSKKETRLRKSAYKLASGLIETWNDYLSGNIYGYVTENKNGDIIESIWGFYGDYEKSDVLSEARSSIDFHVEKVTKKHVHALKQMIRNKVPIEKRKELTV